MKRSQPLRGRSAILLASILSGCFSRRSPAEVGLAQSTVSEHLRILRAARIITGQIERPRICYGLNPDSLRPLAALLNAVFEKDSRGELSGSICCPPSRCESTKFPDQTGDSS